MVLKLKRHKREYSENSSSHPIPSHLLPLPEAASVTNFLGLHPQTSTDKPITFIYKFSSLLSHTNGRTQCSSLAYFTEKHIVKTQDAPHRAPPTFFWLCGVCHPWMGIGLLLGWVGQTGRLSPGEQRACSLQAEVPGAHTRVTGSALAL